MEQENIRNFSIIAHIDHGKSTLADRLIEYCNVIPKKDFKDQILDNLYIERERGITIKSNSILLPYKADNGKTYYLNLIDTPGHVDFTYEVSRSLKSCEGALLLIDASQGVEAQTLANLYLALENNLEIIIVINKIDLPSAHIEEVKHQIDYDLGFYSDEALLASGKEGTGIKEIFEAIIARIPAPKGNISSSLKALIFDSKYDEYRGVVIYTRIFDGSIKAGDEIIFMHNNAKYKVEEVGHFRLKLDKSDLLQAGEVGYIIAGIKMISDIYVGDTITYSNNPASSPLDGFKKVKPVVFSSLYPIASDDYEELTEALNKLKLNDASLIFTKDSSTALGFGYRCGFLGLLHLEIVQERLEREFNVSFILTAPSGQYKIFLRNEELLLIDNPVNYPDPSIIEHVEEPFIKAMIILPQEYLGKVINLCLEKRGVQKDLKYLDEKRIELIYDMPLGEIIYDFYDRLKSISRGYASFDYELAGFKQTDLVKIDILVAGKPVDALSMLVHRDKARERAKKACERLKDNIPRQQFSVPIQGAIGGNIIARETISAFRKDVIAKCYGGDITRKRKLLERQKEGKKRMKMIGNIEIPQSAFLAVLKSDED